MSSLIIRKRERMEASPKQGLSKTWIEYQVLDGRSIVARLSTQTEAENWITKKEQKNQITFEVEHYTQNNSLGMNVSLWRIIKNLSVGREIVADSIRYADVACYLANRLTDRQYLIEKENQS